MYYDVVGVVLLLLFTRCVFTTHTNQLRNDYDAVEEEEDDGDDDDETQINLSAKEKFFFL